MIRPNDPKNVNQNRFSLQLLFRRLRLFIDEFVNKNIKSGNYFSNKEKITHIPNTKHQNIPFFQSSQVRSIFVNRQSSYDTFHSRYTKTHDGNIFVQLTNQSMQHIEDSREYLRVFANGWIVDENKRPYHLSIRRKLTFESLAYMHSGQVSTFDSPAIRLLRSIDSPFSCISLFNSLFFVTGFRYSFPIRLHVPTVASMYG